MPPARVSREREREREVSDAIDRGELFPPQTDKTKTGFRRERFASRVRRRRARSARADRLQTRTRDVPVTRTMVSLPERSVTCCEWVRGRDGGRQRGVRDGFTGNLRLGFGRRKSATGRPVYAAGRGIRTTNVSLNDAKMCATPNTCSPWRGLGRWGLISSTTGAATGSSVSACGSDAERARSVKSGIGRRRRAPRRTRGACSRALCRDDTARKAHAP